MGSVQLSHDIVIVGAGPVGLTLGLILHAYGQKPIILERHATQYALPRAVGIFHQAVQVYHALGLHDILFQSAFKELRDQMTGWNEFVGSDNATLLKVPFGAPLKTGASSSFALHQPTLESVLEKVCKTRGIPVIRSTKVVHLQDEGSQVRLRTEAPDGECDHIVAKFVVGCDGANSIVRQFAGISLIDSGGIRSRWLVVDVVPKSTAVSREWKDAFVGKQYMNWKRPRTSVPSPLNRRRWEFMILPHETDDEARDPNFAWPLLAEFGCTPDNANIDKIATYTLEGKWVDRFYNGRLILAGDAAHTTPPFLGQGLNSGLRDAMNLSWRLDFALRNPDQNYQRLFQDFSEEQLGTTKKLVMGATALERLFCVLGPEEAKLRDDMLLKGPPPSPPDLERFDQPGQFIPAPHGQFGPREGPGHHFIDDVVELNGVQGRLYELMKFGWLILQAENSESDGDEAVSATTMQQFDKVSRATKLVIGKNGFRDTKGTFTKFFQDHGVAAVILRPDHYVYATMPKVEELEGLVRGLLQYTD